MMTTTNNHPEYFSISEGGPVYRILMKMRLEKKQEKLALVSIAITWVPLLIITIIEGTFNSGVKLPFLQDVAMHVRLLVTLPMLLLIRLFIESKVAVVVKYLSDTLVSAEDKVNTFPKILRRGRKLTNSVLAEIIMLGLVIAITISPIKGGMMSGLQRETDLWMFAGNEGNHALSFAGKWAVYISIPVFQFILLWWLWRYFVWVVLLFRISRMKLKLEPTHPDLTGGLGILFLAQKYFILFFLAVCTVASGVLIARLISTQETFNSICIEAIGYIILCLFLVLIPMLFFSSKLMRLKHGGLLQLSKLGISLSGKFESEWINDTAIEKKLTDTLASTSTVQDYSTVFRSVAEIRIFPITVKEILTMIFLLIIPYTPILFIHFSVVELLQKLLGLLM
jgi:hypothetical protein